MFFRALLVFCVLLCAPVAQAQYTKGTLNSQVGQDFPNNTTGTINPSIMRTFLNNLIASVQQYASVNAQVGTTYTVLVTDYGKLLTFSNAAAVAVSVPAASGSFTPFSFFVSNNGAGNVTLTPTAGTIGGASSLVLTQTQGVFVVSDGTNWQIFKGFGAASGISSLNLLTGIVAITNGDGIAAIVPSGQNIPIAVTSDVARRSGSFTPGNLIVSTDSAGTMIDAGVAPIVSVAGGQVYSNNGTISAAPSFNTTLRLQVGSSSAPAFSFAAHSGSGMYYNTNAINFADSVVFGDLATAYKKVTIYGANTQSMGIKSSTNNTEASIFFVDGNNPEWRIGANVSGNGHFDIRDNTTPINNYLVAGSTAGWTSSSDGRLKEDVETLSVLDRLDQYRAVSYRLRGTGARGLGVIAQELDLIFPELVDKSGLYMGVAYSPIGAISLQGVKELRDRLTALQQRVEQLEHP